MSNIVYLDIGTCDNVGFVIWQALLLALVLPFALEGKACQHDGLRWADRPRPPLAPCHSTARWIGALSCSRTGPALMFHKIGFRTRAWAFHDPWNTNLVRQQCIISYNIVTIHRFSKSAWETHSKGEDKIIWKQLPIIKELNKNKITRTFWHGNLGETTNYVLLWVCVYKCTWSSVVMGYSSMSI